MSKILVIPFGIALLLALFVSTAHSDLSPADKEQFLAPVKDHVRAIENQIPQWESTARLQFRISAGVFFLGLVIAALQLWTRSWTKTAVAVVGLAVSGMTGWLSQGFPADRRAYLDSIIETRARIREIQTQMDVYRSNRDLIDAVAMLNFISEKIAPIEAKLTETEKKLVALTVPMSKPLMVYAAETAPLGSVQGFGECNSLWQAQENSQAAAVEKMVSLLVSSASLSLEPGDRDLLRTYVSRYGTKAQVRLEQFQQGPPSGTQRFQTRLALSATYLSPFAVKSFLQSERARKGKKLTREDQTQSIRQQVRIRRPNMDVDGFLEHTFTLPLKGGSVRLEASNPKDGSFVFFFDVAPAAPGSARVSLKSVEIHQDASGGSTRWSFDVLSGSKVIISLPTQRWDDSERPTTCVIDPEAGFSGTAGVSNDAVQLTLVGLKPKASSAE